MSSEANPPLGLLLSDDLMDSSRITGAARQLGLTFTAAKSQAALQDLAAGKNPRCVIVDLSNPGLDIVELVRNWQSQPYIVAYGSHVETATLRRAREAGCDLVLPRSKFFEDLPHALAGWFAGNK
jgi:CheY-like chemotaxis protein